MPSEIPADDRNPTDVAALRRLLTPRGPDPSTLAFAVVAFFVGCSVDPRVHWSLSRSLTHDGDAAVRSGILALALGAILAAASRVRRLRWAVAGLCAGCLAVTTFLGSEQAGRLVGWTMGSAMIHERRCSSPGWSPWPALLLATLLSPALLVAHRARAVRAGDAHAHAAFGMGAWLMAMAIGFWAYSPVFANASLWLGLAAVPLLVASLLDTVRRARALAPLAGTDPSWLHPASPDDPVDLPLMLSRLGRPPNDGVIHLDVPPAGGAYRASRQPATLARFPIDVGGVLRRLRRRLVVRVAFVLAAVLTAALIDWTDRRARGDNGRSPVALDLEVPSPSFSAEGDDLEWCR